VVDPDGVSPKVFTPHNNLTPNKKSQPVSRLRTLLQKLKYKSADRKYGCVLLPVGGELGDKVLALAAKIPADLLTEDGVETEPHITVLYGLHDEFPSHVADVLSKFRRPVRFYLGPVGVFENDEHDVLMVAVGGPDLYFLNGLLRTHCTHTLTHSDYRPHCTLGYVKKGEGRKLAAQLGRMDEVGECAELIYSSPDRKRTQITLMPDKPTKYAADPKLDRMVGEIEDLPDGSDRNEKKVDLARHIAESGSPYGRLYVAGAMRAEEGDKWLTTPSLPKHFKSPPSLTVGNQFKPEGGLFRIILRPSAHNHPSFLHLSTYSGDGVRQTGYTVPVYSKRDLAFLTEHMPEQERKHLSDHLSMHLPDTHPEDAKKDVGGGETDWRPNEVLPEDFYAMRADEVPVRYGKSAMYTWSVDPSGDPDKPHRLTIVRRRLQQGYPLFSSLHETEQEAHSEGQRVTDRLLKMTTLIDRLRSGGSVKNSTDDRPVRYGNPKPTHSDLVTHAAAAMDAPLDDVAVKSLADHLAETHPDNPAVLAFVDWTNGGEWTPLIPHLRNTPHYTQGPTGPNITVRPADFSVHPPIKGEPTPQQLALNWYTKFRGNNHWTQVKHRPTERQDTLDYTPSSRRKVKTLEVAQHLYDTGGPENLIHAVIGLRHFSSEREADRRSGVREGKVAFAETQQPVRYEGEHLQAHPDIAGFKIEHALRSLATDHTFTDSGRQLAAKALTEGDTSALWPLHDELQDTGHPMADKYRWLQAASDIHLDRAVGHALSAVGGSGGPLSAGSAVGLFRHAIAKRDGHPALVEAAGLLLDQGHSPEALHKSLDRWRQKSSRGFLKQRGNLRPEQERQWAMSPATDDAERYRTDRKLKYSLKDLIAKVKGRYRPNADFAKSQTNSAQQVKASRLVDDMLRHHSGNDQMPAAQNLLSSRLAEDFPDHFTGPDYAADAHSLAAVAAGKKPSASVSRNFLELHPVGQELARRFDNFGVDMGSLEDGQEKVLVGLPTDKKGASKLSGKAVSRSTSDLEPLSLMGDEPKPRLKVTPPEAGYDVKTQTPKNIKDIYRAVDVPEKYRSSPALSEFISAVRNVRSSQQEVRRQIASAQYKKMKLTVEALRDAISDAPHTASANTAHAVKHDGDLQKVEAAAALYGLQTNSPALLVFHEDDNGQHLLHKFGVMGSAEKLRKRLDEAGLLNRTLLPTENGWDVCFFDHDGSLMPHVQKAAQSEGAELQTSRGVGVLLGGGDEAEGEKSSRKSFRSVIKSYERSLQPNAGVQQIATNSSNPLNNQLAGAVAPATGQYAGTGAPSP
jgi:2'-5' RNA ligase